MWKDKRLWFLLVPSIAILSIDLPVMLTLLYSIAAMFVIAGVSHLTRKVIFPYIDMEIVKNKAMENSTGAAIVFLGVSIIISAIIVGTSVWLSS